MTKYAGIAARFVTVSLVTKYAGIAARFVTVSLVTKYAGIAARFVTVSLVTKYAGIAARFVTLVPRQQNVPQQCVTAPGGTSYLHLGIDGYIGNALNTLYSFVYIYFTYLLLLVLLRGH